MSRRALRFRSEAEMPEAMRRLLQPAVATEPVVEPRRKYGNHIVRVDGIRFDSKREANYYKYLKHQREKGEIKYFLRQVPIHLPGGTKLVVDFMVMGADGAVEYIDAKGRETPVFRLKHREVRHHYPDIRIRLV
jgi:hypothetical protein